MLKSEIPLICESSLEHTIKQKWSRAINGKNTRWGAAVTCTLDVSIHHLSLCLQTLWLSTGAFTHRTALRCIWLNAVLVPWCVSVCQSLWFWTADGGKGGAGGLGEIFPSISRVLVPFGTHTHTHTHCHSAVHSQNAERVLARSRAVVAGADRETGSVLAGLFGGVEPDRYICRYWPMNDILVLIGISVHVVQYVPIYRI